MCQSANIVFIFLGPEQIWTKVNKRITNAIVASANVTVLIALLVLYAKVYKTSKANFTIGLILFASLLMLHNVLPFMVTL